MAPSSRNEPRTGINKGLFEFAMTVPLGRKMLQGSLSIPKLGVKNISERDAFFVNIVLVVDKFLTNAR